MRVKNGNIDLKYKISRSINFSKQHLSYLSYNANQLFIWHTYFVRLEQKMFAEEKCHM